MLPHDPSRDGPRSVLRLPAPIRSEIRRWTIEAYPDEACGVLVGRHSGLASVVGRAFLAGNLEQELRGSRYRLDPRDHLAAFQWARQRNLEIVGYWHSHPDHPPEPSELDRRLAWERVSYLIVAVSAEGAVAMRCWRLCEGTFDEEALSS